MNRRVEAVSCDDRQANALRPGVNVQFDVLETGHGLTLHKARGERRGEEHSPHALDDVRRLGALQHLRVDDDSVAVDEQ